MEPRPPRGDERVYRGEHEPTDHETYDPGAHARDRARHRHVRQRLARGTSKDRPDRQKERHHRDRGPVQEDPFHERPAPLGLEHAIERLFERIQQPKRRVHQHQDAERPDPAERELLLHTVDHLDNQVGRRHGTLLGRRSHGRRRRLTVVRLGRGLAAVGDARFRLDHPVSAGRRRPFRQRNKGAAVRLVILVDEHAVEPGHVEHRAHAPLAVVEHVERLGEDQTQHERGHEREDRAIRQVRSHGRRVVGHEPTRAELPHLNLKANEPREAPQFLDRQVQRPLDRLPDFPLQLGHARAFGPVLRVHRYGPSSYHTIGRIANRIENRSELPRRTPRANPSARISQMRLNHQRPTNAFHLVSSGFSECPWRRFGRTQWVKHERGLCGSVLMAA